MIHLNHFLLIEDLSEPPAIILSINSDWPELYTMMMENREIVGLKAFHAQDSLCKLFS
jgi:hypothetical protein